MKKAENLNEAQKPNLRLGAVISRYSDADIFRFSDGWWITTYSKEQKRFIKLIGSFKTKDEARAEIRSLNGLRFAAKRCGA